MTRRGNRIAAAFIILGLLMCASYLVNVHRERDIAHRTCEFNQSVLGAVKARADINTRYQTANNGLLLGFTDLALKGHADKRTVALFRAYKSANDSLIRDLAAHPLPAFPEDACSRP